MCMNRANRARDLAVADADLTVKCPVQQQVISREFVGYEKNIK